MGFEVQEPQWNDLMLGKCRAMGRKVGQCESSLDQSCGVVEVMVKHKKSKTISGRRDRWMTMESEQCEWDKSIIGGWRYSAHRQSESGEESV